MPSRMSSLGLVTDYCSDSENEEAVKSSKLEEVVEMKADDDPPAVTNNNLVDKFADFMKEIADIPVVIESFPPPMPVPTDANCTDTESVGGWQECYDETSGYAYYWHTETNQVTWEMPDEYRQYYEAQAALLEQGLESKKSRKRRKKNRSIDKQPSLFPSYSQDSDSGKQTDKIVKTTQPEMVFGPQLIGPQLPGSIEYDFTPIIPIVGPQPLIGPAPPIPPIGLYVGPMVLADKRSSVINNDNNSDNNKSAVKRLKDRTPSPVNPKSPKSGSFQLIASYGEEGSDDETTPVKPSPSSASSYDVLNELEAIRPNIQADVLDMKFQRRKATLAIKQEERPCPSGSTTWNKQYNPSDASGNPVRKGFGFSVIPNDEEFNNYNRHKPDVFQKISFIKSETLFHEQNDQIDEDGDMEERMGKDSLEKEILRGDEDMTVRLRVEEIVRKLRSWNKNSTAVSRLARVLIQTEVLIRAWNAKSLNSAFLNNWFDEECLPVVKQSEEINVPFGWTCIWDRERKSYVYQHTTGERQTELPSAATINDKNPKKEKIAPKKVIKPETPPIIQPQGCKPPPLQNSEDDEPLPPGEDAFPCVAPPPPKISASSTNSDNSSDSDMDIDSPPPPPPPPSYHPRRPPSPPPTEPTDHTIQRQAAKKSAVDCALDLFYSEVALMKEGDKEDGGVDGMPLPPSPPSFPIAPLPPKLSEPVQRETELVVKKKRKTKLNSGLNSGLSLKKKGVTSLVAKWQEVQRDLDYDDD